MPNKFRPDTVNRSLALGLMTLSIVTMAGELRAQLLNVPNGSFESQSGLGQPFGVNINIDSWQKAGRPGYFPAGGYNGFYWEQTAGVFNAPAYQNQVGDQAGFILSFPQAGIFQDYDTRDWNDATPTHDFNAVFEAGKSYALTVGLYGKSLIEGYSSLELTLYYRDGFNAIVPVASTNITYSAAIFSDTGPYSLRDFEVKVPTVQVSDSWAGQNIGIKIASVQGDGNGYWDLDNVRLQAVPEPACLAFLMVGGGGWLVTRAKRRLVV